MDKNIGLILEGGGMRGLYTCGVLDFFMEKGILFGTVYGVSAGSCHATSYIAGQQGRSFRVSVDYLKDKNYCGVYSLLTTGDLFNVKMIYDLIPNKLNPFDYKAFENCDSKLYAVVTNCKTGKAEYHHTKHMQTDIEYIRASSSLPVVSRIVEIDGNEYLDGGIADPIPIKKSIEDGHSKNVLVLTQHDGYKKQPNRLMPIIRKKFKNYPDLIKVLENRHEKYNETLKFIKEQQKKGLAFVIQPRKPVEIGRVEKSKKVLTRLYEDGFNDASCCYKDLLKFINEGD